MLRRVKLPLMLLAAAAVGATLLAFAQRMRAPADTPIADWTTTDLTIEGCKTKAKEAAKAAGADVHDEQKATLTARSWADTVKISCLDAERLVHFTTFPRQAGSRRLLGSEVKRLYQQIEKALPLDDPSRLRGAGVGLLISPVPLKHMKQECMRVADATLKASGARETYRDSGTLGLTMADGTLVVLHCPARGDDMLSIIPRRDTENKESIKQTVVAHAESQIESLSPSPSKQFAKNMAVREGFVRGKFSPDLCMMAARNSFKAMGRIPFTDGDRISSEKDGAWTSVTCYREDWAQFLTVSPTEVDQDVSRDAYFALRDEMLARLPLR